MGRWLGIDHGTRRIGIAAGGTADGIATPVTAVSAEPSAEAFTRIGKLAADYGAEGVVVGWPLNMDGSEGPQGRLAREMAGQLADATGLDVRLWDERLSSFAADEALAGTYTRKKKRARHDAVAASIVLGHFLTADGPATAPRPDEAAAPGPD